MYPYLYRLSALLPLIASTIAPSLCQAQTTYPNRAIHFITPFPPGGSLDPLTRMSAQKLSEKWGVPIIVENRPGANTIIGTNAVAKSLPDGYTILVAGNPHVVNPSLFPTPYDAIKDFTGVATIARSRQVLIVNPSLPVLNLKGLIALAKSKPGQLTFGSSGVGNTNHLAGELFGSITGTKMLHIPYKGGGPVLNDLLGGHIDVAFLPAPIVIQLIESNRVTLLGSTHTLSTRYKNWINYAGYCLVLPKDTSPETAKFWNGIVKEYLDDTTVQKDITLNLGAVPESGRDFLKNNIDKIKASK
jgi:tripartite-type tricarboxylate transporter receptor subunit TctC